MAERTRQVATFLDIGKIPPQDIQAEESILGVILSEPERLPYVMKILKPECFYKQEHAIIFKSMLELQNKEMGIDLVTIQYQLRNNNELDDVGGAYGLASLLSKGSGFLQLQTHTFIVMEMFIRREVICICQETMEDAYDGNIDILDLKEKLIQRLEALYDVGFYQKEYFSDAIDKVLNSITTIKELGFNPDLLTTDTFMDNLIQIKPNNVIVIASLQKHGKTKLTIYTIHKLLAKYNDRIAVLWYSMEDDIDKIIKNRISIETGLSYTQQSGEEENFKLTMDDLTFITEAANEMKNDNVEIIDEPSKISSISSHFRGFCKKNDQKICILIIDNFFITSNLEQGENETVKEARVASFIQNLNASLQSQGYKALIFLLDHLKKELFNDKLDSGYRPLQGMLKGSNRKGEILTQLILLNQTGQHTDLVAEEDET